ncbi:MAG: S8 family serine peptidase [Candidatus Saliniplasma sp.]
MKEISSNRIWTILSVLLLLISVFAAVGIVSSRDTAEEETVMLVYKRDISTDALRSTDGLNVLAEYDEFVLVSANPESRNSLMEQGYIIEELEDRDEVNLNSYTFNVDDGIPDISDDLRIDSYPEGVKRPHIVQFMGPIMDDWQEELIDMGVTIHEYRHRYNLIVGIDSDTAQRVEELDFVNWVGIYHPAYKFDQKILEAEETLDLEINTFDTADTYNLATKIARDLGEVSIIRDGHIFAQAEPDEIKTIADLPEVISIHRRVTDLEFLNYDATWVTQTNEYEDRRVTEEGVTGTGELVTVCDSELYTTDGGHEMWKDPDGNEFGDDHRKIQDYYSIGGDLNDGQYHGSHVTGTVLGDAPTYESYDNQDGNAMGARLIHQDIGTSDGGLELPDDMYNDSWGASYDAGSRAHTNSWGGGTGTEYDGLAVTADEFIWDHKDYNILFAAGNDGDNRGSSEHSISQQAEGKNVLTVGAVTNYDSQNTMASFSSRGYAEDGRIKPTLLHAGENIDSASRSADGYSDMSGTSMSTPGLAGQVAQVRHYYEGGWYPSGVENPGDGFNPSNALVRSTLINGAVEITGDGAYSHDEKFPNNDQGHGRSMLDRVMHFEGDERKLLVFDSEKEDIELNTGENWNMEFDVDDSTQDLEVTLVWTDYPGASGSSPAIVNDLDLELDTPDGTRYVGNAFTGYDPGYSQPDPTSNPWNGPRSGEWDGLNVEENILLLPEENGVETGSYEITVSGHNVPESSQPFAVVVSGGVAEGGSISAPSNPEPVDGATGVTTDLELSVEVEHEEGDSMDVSFYDASDDSLIHTDNNVESGARAYADWTDLNPATEYTWYAIADDGSETSTSNTWTFTTEEEGAPSIILNRPEGGETWYANENEDILWETEEADGSITGLDLEYSTDDGDSWSYISQGIDDTGIYDWDIPDEPTSEARVRATVHDTNGLSASDTSGVFEIVGMPPAPPENLQVQHYGSSEVEEPGETGDYSFDVWTTSFTGPYDETVPVDVYYPTDDSGSPYPGITIGHGFTMDKSYFETWGEYYASWGYVTAVPSLQYAGMFNSDHEKCAYELIATLQFLDEQNGETDSPIEGSVDVDNMGLTGFSLGAKASILASQYDASEGTNIIDVIAPMAAAIENDPDPLPDLDLIDIPVQLQVGENDEVAPPEDNSELVYDGLEDSPTQYFMIDGANHNQYADSDPSSGGIGDGQAEISREEQHQIARKYSTSFFNYYLKEQSGYDEYLYGEFADQDVSDGILVFNEYKNVDYNLLEDPEGTEHNRLTWNASPDDPDEVSHYNVYRSENQDGSYELISSVDAEGSAEYSHLDENKGTADDIYWWYIVRSVGTNGVEEENINAVQEPGAEESTFDVSLYTNEDADGWNFVSFNLIPSNNSLESILEDQESGISGSYEKVMYYDASADEWSSYVPSRADHYNDIDTWDHTMGVWIQMDVDDTLTVEGMEPTSTEITLNPGWNMVSYPSATANVGGTPEEVTIVGHFDASQNNNLAYDYDPDNFEFETGEGYYLYNDASEDVIWTVDY